MEASSSSRGSPFFAHPMRVIEAFAARTVPGNTPDPKRSLKNARITPPWETTTGRAPASWRARMSEIASSNRARTSSSVSAPTSVQRSSSGNPSSFLVGSGLRVLPREWSLQ